MIWNIKEYYQLTRREFINSSIKAITSLSLAGLLASSVMGQSKGVFWSDLASPDTNTKLYIVKGYDIYGATRKAIELAGGLAGVVKKGDRILVKPNMSFNRAPEYGANTHPDVVTAVVDMVYKAGAKQVYIVDNTVEQARGSYDISGIENAGKSAGAKVILFNQRDTREIKIPSAQKLKSTTIHRLCLECDAIINVPVAKSHNLTKLSLSIKNLMGLAGEGRWRWHKNISKCLADFYSYVKPPVTIMDASRILLRNGPSGGNLNDVKWTNMIIVSKDGVACDAYATTLFGMAPSDIGYIKECANRGLGITDPEQVKFIKETI